MGSSKKYDKPGRPKIGRPFVCYETNATYDSFSECASDMGLNKGSVKLCVTGCRKQHKGYHFGWYDGIKNIIL